MKQHHNEHFCIEGHKRFLGNVSISLIDKTVGFQPTKTENEDPIPTRTHC